MNDTFSFGGPILWEPAPADIERSHLAAFIQRHTLSDFDELQYRSVEDVGWFTAAILAYLDIKFNQPFQQVLDTSAGIAWPRWCVGGEMNIVESCLDRWLDAGKGDATALIWESESGQQRRMTYSELELQVARTANGLRSLGFGVGDRIGLYLPMIPEIVIALLAIAKIGAIVLPLFSGYGATAVKTRLEDGGASGLFTADGFMRRGKFVDAKSVSDEAVEELVAMRHVIVVEYTGTKIAMVPGRDLSFNDLISGQPDQAPTANLDPEAVLMILYTSGTTGRPKGAVHTHCGFPVKAAQDMAFGTDVHEDDVVYWMTDMGWMMGPWLVFGTLILGGSFLLYDGAPDYPSRDRVWSLCSEHGVTVLGVSPSLIRSLMPHGVDFLKAHDLSSLRCFASTGEAWNPEPWHWLFSEVGGAMKPIINYSGGTEISGGILMGNPLKPLKACAFAAPCPGIDADIFDEAGNSLRSEVGELVIKSPWIGMTRGFWNDPDRYEQTYWSRWPDTWVHGDFAYVDDEGSWFILGRSDDTLKIAGKRIGPAEIESILIQEEGVIEAAVIGIPDEIKGSAIIAFCVTDGREAQDVSLSQRLTQRVSKELGKPLAPKGVYFLPDLPKTRNAKVMRRLLRAAYLDEALGDTSALVNPEVLIPIRGLRDER